MKKLTIEEMQNIAKSMGGNCLSKRYTNNFTKLNWRCFNNHIFRMKPNHIKSGHWCPKCRWSENGKKLRLSLSEMKKIAIEKGGICLSKSYGGVHTKLKWMCSKGHIWEAIPNCIKNRNSWCPYCLGQKGITIEDMRKIAEDKGGKCLSKKYVNDATKLEWICSKGHKWDAIPNNIKCGKWCPECAIKKNADNLRSNIRKMEELAKKKGGICLSHTYITNHTKLTWQCSKKHTWNAEPASIKNHWCPICSQKHGEKICRRHFETIFKKRFPSSRPTWLKSQKGYTMELDGYNKLLKLAFEYNGSQHYVNHHFFHKGFNFKIQQERDELKRKLCSQNGITLIEIPYTINHLDMKNYILEQLNSIEGLLFNDKIRYNHIT